MNTKNLPDLKNSESPIKSGPFFEVYENRIELFWEGVARFIILENGEIQTIAEKDASQEQVEIYKSGSPYTTALFMKRHLVLHGSCLKINDKVCGFLGHSGMGKSTTARAFMEAGHELISDDFIAFKDALKGNELLPGLPQMRLWQDALEHFKLSRSEKFKIHEKLDKYSLPTKASRKQEKLDYIFILENADTLDISELRGFASLEALMTQLKPVFYLNGGKREQRSFLQLAEVANTIPTAKLKRPRKHELLPDLVKLVERYIA